MNHNQLLLKEALTKGLHDALFTHNKYREILDICLVALEEKAQDSESKQVDLKELQFYFEDAYSEGMANFGHNLIYYVNAGILKAKKKDKRLFGMQPSIITFDEMHTHIQPGGVFGKFKNLVQVKKNKKDEAVHVPAGATIKPEPIESKLLTTEGMKKILMNSGYAVIDNQEFSENYIDVRTLKNQTGYEKWLFKKANEFRRNVLEAFQELYKNERITFEEYAENVASIDSWRIAMNSKETKKQLDEAYKHKTNVFRQEPTVQGEIKYNRAEGSTFIREAEEKDEYATALEEWQASFEKWKESQVLSFERMNEIGDKVNAVYGALKYLKPLIERIDSDQNIIKGGLGLKGVKPGETKQANVNKTLDDYLLTDRQLRQVTEHVTKNLNTTNTTVHFTGGQMTEEQANEFVTRMKNELAKSIREDRLKGGK